MIEPSLFCFIHLSALITSSDCSQSLRDITSPSRITSCKPDCLTYMEDKLVPPPLSCSLYQLLAGDGGLLMCAKNRGRCSACQTAASGFHKASWCNLQITLTWPQHFNSHQPLLIWGQDMERVSSFKYLGVHINEDFTLHSWWRRLSSGCPSWGVAQVWHIINIPSHFYSCVVESILTHHSCVVPSQAANACRKRWGLNPRSPGLLCPLHRASPSTESTWELPVLPMPPHNQTLKLFLSLCHQSP